LDIRVRVHLAHFWKIRQFLALFKHFSTGSNQMLPVLEHSKRDKNSLVFQKCAKFLVRNSYSTHQLRMKFALTIVTIMCLNDELSSMTS
jgi:hypothetical protein